MSIFHEISLLVSDAINAAGGKTNATAGIFATYPAPYLYIGTGFFDQVSNEE